MTDSEVMRLLAMGMKQMPTSAERPPERPPLPPDQCSPAAREVLQLSRELAQVRTIAFDAVQQMSLGNLDFELPRDNAFFSPIKDLQAKLKHLVWQTNRLAQGDYHQQIDFLGDFATSFNQLIQSLRERRSIEQELERSNQQFKLIAENTLDVIWKIDLATMRYNYISPSVLGMRGYTVQEAMSQSVEESLTPASAQQALTTLQSYLSKPELANLYVCDEYQQPCKDGRIIDIELTATVVFDANGQPIEIVGVTRDITRRKATETALRRSEANLAKLLKRQTQANQKLNRQLQYFYDHTVNAIAFFDIDHHRIHITKCNQRWAMALGMTPNDVENRDIDDLIDPESSRMYHSLIDRALAAGDTIQEQCFWRGKHIEVVLIPIVNEQTQRIDQGAALVYDVSERKEMERQLTQIGIRIETRERRQLAADLHDNVGPLLSSMNMYLSTLSRKPEIAPHAALVNDVRDILREAITSVREISNNLSPQVLTNYGLTSALELFFETKQKLICIRHTNTLGDLRFNELKEIMCYNIIKELYNNTIKYADATAIDLSLSQCDGKIFIQYRDNGKGFDLAQKMAEPSNNLGLFSIINRINNLDGTYQMDTASGQGFLVNIEFPL